MDPTTPDIFAIPCLLEIDAASGTNPIPKFSMVAYTGAAMVVRGFPHPVVVDLKGMNIPLQSIPIRLDHDVGKGVGHSRRISIKGNRLMAEGLISRDTSWARDVAKSGINGFPWQASIGASVVESDFIGEGQKVGLNGKTFDGPVFVIRSSILKEISFVDMGADLGTSARIAAQMQNAKKESVMDPKEKAINAAGEKTESPGVENTEAGKIEAKKTDAGAGTSSPAQEHEKVEGAGGVVQPGAGGLTATSPVAVMRAEASAESVRITAIRLICGGKHGEIEAKALGEGWDQNKCELEVLRASRPKAPAVSVVQTQSPALVLEAGLCLRATNDLKFVGEQYSKEVVAAAMEYRHMGLTSIAAMCVRAEGIEAAHDNIAVVRAALSTTSFPALLSNVANKALLKSFVEHPGTALTWCGQGDLPDFKAQTRARLNLAGGLKEIGPDGEAKHLVGSDESAIVRLKTQALAFAIGRQDLINDDLGALTRLPAAFGAISRRKIDDLVYTKLLLNKLSDGTSSLFSSANGNYITGTATALSAEGLRKAIEMFRKQTDSSGNAIGLEPRYLGVPPELEFIARQLVTSANLVPVGSASAADKNNPTSNPFQGKLEVVVEPRLSNSTYSGSSTTAWYLMCDSVVTDTIEVDFLNGQRSPMITQVGNGSTLRIEYEVVFDVEANVLDFRGMTKSKGAA